MDNIFKVYDNNDNYLFHIDISGRKCNFCPLIHIEIKIWRKIDYYSSPKLFALFNDSVQGEASFNPKYIQSFLINLKKSLPVKILTIGIDPDKFCKVKSFKII